MNAAKAKLKSNTEAGDESARKMLSVIDAQLFKEKSGPEPVPGDRAPKRAS
jgi:hypothetical protein